MREPIRCGVPYVVVLLPRQSRLCPCCGPVPACPSSPAGQEQGRSPWSSPEKWFPGEKGFPGGKGHGVDPRMAAEGECLERQPSSCVVFDAAELGCLFCKDYSGIVDKLSNKQSAPGSVWLCPDRSSGRVVLPLPGLGSRFPSLSRIFFFQLGGVAQRPQAANVGPLCVTVTHFKRAPVLRAPFAGAVPSCSTTFTLGPRVAPRVQDKGLSPGTCLSHWLVL